MKNVYYHAMEVGVTNAVVVTSEAYWRQNRFVDDGGGSDYDAIEAAMESAGAYRVAESVYEVPPTGIAALVQAMANRGLNLVHDDAFSAFVAAKP